MRSSQPQANAKAQQNAANYQAQVARNNAEAARQAGEAQAQQIYREGAQRLGLQRATLAANNADLGFGSALNIQRDTAEATGLDAATARYNALTQGIGLENQATLLRAQGQNARAAGDWQAAGTLLSGVSQFASQWAGFQQKGIFGATT
ncbi:MAG: hypothetical protein QJR07_06995 [Acetobacteraceae bacterium]|nr:hypothetical protein [Acetobacteraceae bacterium]